MADEMGYKAGDLNLSIQAVANDTLKSLDAVYERLVAINKGLTQIQSKTKSVNKSSSGNTTSSQTASPKTPKTTKNTFLDVAKWAFVIRSATRLGRVMANVVQMGADYGETLNLWQVAMNDYTERATVFVNKMNEAYGISEKTLMNAQATFKNMLGSLGGLSDEMAYQLSESVTRMAIDYASLYNVGIEEAMTKFQAALAGQVRPIRSVSGYDITENTLYQLYQSIGGTKTVRQLSQTDKRLLDIYAIFNQMSASGAINDMERTIGSFANQSRVMAESFDEVQSYLGLIVTNGIETLGIMQGINAVLAFTGEFLKGIANVMGAVKGQGSGVFDDTTKGAEDASKAIDEVQGKLLGFDKIRSLSSQEEGGTDVAIDEALANAMADYNSALGDSTLGTKEIARGWLENIGLIYDAETATYSASEEFEGLYDVIKIVSSALVGVLAVLGGKGILAIVGKLSAKFSGLGSAMKSAFSLKNLGIMALVGALYYMYTTNEDFRDSVNNLITVLGDALGTILEPIAGLIIIIAPILADILTVVAEILTPIIDIVANVIKFLDETGALKAVLIVITTLFALWTTLIIAQNHAWLASPITWIIAAIIAAVAILGVVISSIIKNFDSIKEAIQNVFRAIGNFFANIGIAIANIFIGIVNFCIDVLNTLLKPLDWVIEKLGGKGLEIPHWEAKVSYDPIPEFANGGLPDKGSMFVAGEAGAEMVYNMPSGQSGVANIQQIAQATYSGTMQALNDWWGGSHARGDIPQLQEASATGMYQAVTGVARSYGERWNNY